MTAEFHKYHALGNDMVVIDPATFKHDLTPETAAAICKRNYGLGADGICYGPLSASQPFEMRFFNPDGTEAEKSGNGLRIFARYLLDRGYVTAKTFDMKIGDSIIGVETKDKDHHTIHLTMGRLSFKSDDIPMTGPPREAVDERLEIGGRTYRATCVNIGNPHAVIFGHEMSDISIRQFGPLIEKAPLFPNRINVQFARVIDSHNIHILIWERGAGYTLASGTSSSAAAGAAIRTGQCVSPVVVHMPGGTMRVSVDKDWNVTLIGEVESVAQGQFSHDLIAKFT